jgi:hypothetical protein
VLGLERVGAHDDFFDLGGSSLDVEKAIHRLGEAFGREHDPEGRATLAGSIEVVRVPGDHTTHLGDHVDEVAAILGRWLDRV